MSYTMKHGLFKLWRGYVALR